MDGARCWPRAAGDAAAPTFSPDGLYFLGPVYDAAWGLPDAARPAYDGCHDCHDRCAATRTRIKICGLTREQDVDAAVTAGADAIGFVLYGKSPRYVTARARRRTCRPPAAFRHAGAAVRERDPGRRASGMCRACRRRLSSSTVTRRQAECLAATGNGARPFMRAARIPLDEAGSPSTCVEYAARLSTRPGHPARRPRRGVWRWRQGIQLVTSSSKRQRSPRLDWWAHTCKRGRWHRAGAAAL